MFWKKRRNIGIAAFSRYKNNSSFLFTTAEGMEGSASFFNCLFQPFNFFEKTKIQQIDGRCLPVQLCLPIFHFHFRSFSRPFFLIHTILFDHFYGHSRHSATQILSLRCGLYESKQSARQSLHTLVRPSVRPSAYYSC